MAFLIKGRMKILGTHKGMHMCTHKGAHVCTCKCAHVCQRTHLISPSYKNVQDSSQRKILDTGSQQEPACVIFTLLDILYMIIFRPRHSFLKVDFYGRPPDLKCGTVKCQTGMGNIVTNLTLILMSMCDLYMIIFRPRQSFLVNKCKVFHNFDLVGIYNVNISLQEACSFLILFKQFKGGLV